MKLKTIGNQNKTPYIQELEMHLEALEKGGYEHFMLKEIYEQPQSILDSMRGRFSISQGKVALGGILDYEEKLINAKRLIFVACGTSCMLAWWESIYLKKLQEYLLKWSTHQSLDIEIL